MVFSDNVFSKTAFPAKIRDIHKIEKNYISITIFGYENQQQISNLCIKKYFHKIFWFDFIEKEDKRCYIPIKDFNTFMHDHILQLEKKFFFGRYLLQIFSKAGKLNIHVNYCWKINGKKIITIPKKWICLIKQLLTLFRMGGQKSPPTSFSPVTSTNVRFGPQKFPTFSFHPFATLKQNFKSVPSPKLLNLNQDHPSKKAIFQVKSL